MEEAERRMEAERERIAVLEQQELDAKKASKEAKKRAKAKAWKRARMLDDVVLPDDSSLLSSKSAGTKTESNGPSPAQDSFHSDSQDPIPRPPSAAPSLTLNILGRSQRLGDFLDEDSDESSDEDPLASRPAALTPRTNQHTVLNRATTATPLPDFAFQDGGNSSEDDRPLGQIVASKQKPRQQRTVGSTLGLDPDLFVSRTSLLSSTSSMPTPQQRPVAEGSDSDEDDVPLGLRKSQSRPPGTSAEDVPLGIVHRDLAGRLDEEMPLGARHPEFAREQYEEDTPLGDHYPGLAYKQAILQQDAQQQEQLRLLAEQQQNFYLAAAQQDMMAQQMMQQQMLQAQQMAMFNFGMGQQAGFTPMAESMLDGGAFAPPAHVTSEKLHQSVSSWRAGVE